MTRTTILAAATAIALASPAFAQYSQDFESATGTGGGVYYDHTGGGFLEGFTPGFDDGTDDDETSFCGSDATAQVAAAVDLSAGVGGSAGATLTINNYDPSTAPTPAAAFLYSGIAFAAGGALATPGDLSANSVSVDVLAPVGQAFDVRVESSFSGTNNAIVFSGVGTGAFQTIGGTLDTGTPLGAFNPADPAIGVIVAFANFTTDPVTSPLTLVADNITLTTAPPTSDCPGDIDGDNDADPDDIAAFIAAFLGGCP